MSKRIRWVTVTFALAGVALFLLMAQGGARPFTTAQATAGSGTLVVALPEGQNVTWLNPLLSVSACTANNYRILSSLLYRPLIWLSPNMTIDWRNSLARSITSSAQGTRYIVRLNSWKWSDGIPITAYDLQAHFYLKRDGARTEDCTYGFGGMPKSVSSFKVINANTFEMRYKPKRGGYLPAWVELSGLSSLTPLPIHSWGKLCASAGFDSRHPAPAATKKLWQCLKAKGGDYRWQGWDVVNGPFTIDRSDWHTGREFGFLRNPNYSGHKAPVSKLITLFEASSTNTFAALRAGTVDIGIVPPSLVPQARSLSKYRLSPATSWSQSVVSLNMNPAAPGDADVLLKDRAVRIALQRGIDQPTIIRDIAHGGWYPAYGPVPSRPDTYVSSLLRKKAVYPFDLGKARQLLQRAGYKLINGVQTKAGRRLNFTMVYLAGDDTIASTAQVLQQNWKQIGIQVDLRSLPYDEFASQLYDPKNFQLYLLAYAGWGFFPDYYPTGEELYNCGGALVVVQGSYCNPKLDKLIEASTAYASSRAAAQARFDAYQNFVAREAVNLYLPNGIGVLAVRKSIANVPTHFTSFSYGAEYWQPTS